MRPSGDELRHDMFPLVCSVWHLLRIHSSKSDESFSRTHVLESECFGTVSTPMSHKKPDLSKYVKITSCNKDARKVIIPALKSKERPHCIQL